MNTSTTTNNQPITVNEAARQLYRALQNDKRNDGSEFVKLIDGSPEWMTEVIHDVHGRDCISPDDTVYEFIQRAAGAFSDSDAESDNDFSDVISEMESDFYTSDLTGWLHERIDHINYVDQATEEYGPFDNICNLLMAAQKLQIEEVAYGLLSALRDFVADNEEEISEEQEEELEVDSIENSDLTWMQFVAKIGSERIWNRRHLYTMDQGGDLTIADMDYWFWLDTNDYSRE